MSRGAHENLARLLRSRMANHGDGVGIVIAAWPHARGDKRATANYRSRLGDIVRGDRGVSLATVARLAYACGEQVWRAVAPKSLNRLLDEEVTLVEMVMEITGMDGDSVRAEVSARIARRQGGV